MQWQCLPFDALTPLQVLDMFKLRCEVFIVEQNCVYQDVDGKDELDGVYHLLGYQDGQLQAYARLLAPGISYPNASLGRILTHSSARGTGAGQALLTQLLTQAQHFWPDKDIDISAQKYLLNFYNSFGFTAISEEYLEDGIPHVKMRLSKS